MADKRVGGIFASSFIAGVLLAAAIVSPRAWEPVPGPYFGLDDGARPAAGGPVQLGAANALAPVPTPPVPHPSDSSPIRVTAPPSE